MMAATSGSRPSSRPGSARAEAAARSNAAFAAMIEELGAGAPGWRNSEQRIAAREAAATALQAMLPTWREERSGAEDATAGTAEDDDGGGALGGGGGGGGGEGEGAPSIDGTHDAEALVPLATGVWLGVSCPSAAGSTAGSRPSSAAATRSGAECESASPVVHAAGGSAALPKRPQSASAASPRPVGGAFGSHVATSLSGRADDAWEKWMQRKAETERRLSSAGDSASNALQQSPRARALANLKAAQQRREIKAAEVKSAQQEAFGLRWEQMAEAQRRRQQQDGKDDELM